MEEREKLRTLLEQSAASGFSVHSGVQLQEWLERFAASVKSRAEDVQAEVARLTDHTTSVEQELKNAFNSFKLLSNLQFIENRVYEEDETLIAKEERDEEQHRVESYENDIFPRYKEAVTTAWNEHLKAARNREPRHRALPYIIGTDEFMRDPYCGLSDSRYKASTSTRSYDSEVEKDGVSMAAHMVASGVISDEEWSDPSNEAVDDPDRHEPAVSAALDFKAMLEAALRASYIPSDDTSRLDPVFEATSTEKRNELESDAGKDEDMKETDDRKASLDDILGKIAREGGEYSPQDPKESANSERASQNIPLTLPPEKSSSDKSSHWSESEDDAAVEEDKNSSPFQGDTEQEQHMEPEETPLEAKVADSSSFVDGSKDRTETSKTSRLKSLFDEDGSDEEEDEVHPLPKRPSSPPLESKASVVAAPSPSGSTDSLMKQPPLPPRSTVLSKLLFGDEDNDEDDALFGPVASKGGNEL